MDYNFETLMQLGSAQTYKCPKAVVVCDIPVSNSTWFLFGQPDPCGISIRCFHGHRELDLWDTPSSKINTSQVLSECLVPAYALGTQGRTGQRRTLISPHAGGEARLVNERNKILDFEKKKQDNDMTF